MAGRSQEDGNGFSEEKMPKIKGYCIISVECQQIMDSILTKEYVFKSKNLLVREFVKNSSDMDRIDLETCLRRVCVMNIPVDISESQLASIMT